MRRVFRFPRVDECLKVRRAGRREEVGHVFVLLQALAHGRRRNVNRIEWEQVIFAFELLGDNPMVPGSRHGEYARAIENRLRLVPLGEIDERIEADDEKKFRAGIFVFPTCLNGMTRDSR